MAWDTDLVEAVYTAPSGKKFTFQYDSKLTGETDLKTATFTFPERDGALVVPLGVGGRRFSFTCFFYGKNSKKEADAFETGLKERGYGDLQHPLYGSHKVVPTGTIARTDDVVSGIGVATVSVTFAETIINVSSINSEVVSTDVINVAADNFEKKSALEFCKDLTQKTIKGAIWAGETFKKGLKIAADVLNKIARTEKSIYTKFQTIESELYSSLDSIMAASENIAIQTIKLFRLPGQTSVNAAAKVEGYAQVAKSIINNFKNNPSNVENAKNQWAMTRLMVESLCVACACGISTAEGDKGFKTREEAVNAALGILDVYDTVIEYEEKNVAKNYFVETGEGFNSMRDIVSLSVQEIVNNSFSLPTRKIEALTCDRQIIELVYNLYGNLEKLDQFILDNKLTYNDLEVVPMGREVVYYV